MAWLLCARSGRPRLRTRSPNRSRHDRGVLHDIRERPDASTSFCDADRVSRRTSPKALRFVGRRQNINVGLQDASVGEPHLHLAAVRPPGKGVESVRGVVPFHDVQDRLATELSRRCGSLLKERSTDTGATGSRVDDEASNNRQLVIGGDTEHFFCPVHHDREAAVVECYVPHSLAGEFGNPRPEHILCHEESAEIAQCLPG